MKQVELVSAMGTVVSIDVRTPARTEGFRRSGRGGDPSPPRDRRHVQPVAPRLVGQQADQRRGCARWTAQPRCNGPSMLVGGADGAHRTGSSRRSGGGVPYGDPGPDPDRSGQGLGGSAGQRHPRRPRPAGPCRERRRRCRRCRAGPTPGDPQCAWRIGISDPHHDRRPGRCPSTSTRAPRGWAVATSGTAELGAHVSDPHTGRFPRSVASATAVTSARRLRRRGGRGRTPAPPRWWQRETERRPCWSGLSRHPALEVAAHRERRVRARPARDARTGVREALGRPPRTLLQSGHLTFERNKPRARLASPDSPLHPAPGACHGGDRSRRCRQRAPRRGVAPVPPAGQARCPSRLAVAGLILDPTLDLERRVAGAPGGSRSADREALRSWPTACCRG